MPPRRTTPTGYELARKLRKELTPAERKLWAYLRNNKINGVKFRRQHAVGNFVSDFSPEGDDVCNQRKVGNRTRWHSLRSQHLEQEEYDKERTIYFELQGYKVIRFWNNQVMNDIEGVIKAIIFATESIE